MCALSLIHPDERSFRKNMFAGFSLNIAARRNFTCDQMIDRKREQSEMIVMRSVAMWWAGAAVAGSLKVVVSLLEAVFFGLLGRALRQCGEVGRNVIGRPVMPCSARRVGVFTEQDEAAGGCRRAAPVEGRRDILAIASVTGWDCSSIGESG